MIVAIDFTGGKRNLKMNIRVHEYKGKKLATTSLSSIQPHIRHHTHHTISPDDFSIISSCHSSSNFDPRKLTHFQI